MRLALAETEIEVKWCPHCQEDRPISEFGICRSRPGGLNLYCRASIRIKMNTSRQALREYKQSRMKHGVQEVKQKDKPLFSPRRIARMLRKLSPTDRVREAIRCGAETQTEIAQVTKLSRDDVCDMLAMLILWDRSVASKLIDQRRIYFIPEVPERKPNKRAELKPFSSISALMPGRKRIA